VPFVTIKWDKSWSKGGQKLDKNATSSQLQIANIKFQNDGAGTSGVKKLDNLGLFWGESGVFRFSGKFTVADRRVGHFFALLLFTFGKKIAGKTLTYPLASVYYK